MAKRNRDPVFRELIRAVNESGQTAVPVTVTVRGTVLHGSLIAQDRYFAELIESSPLMGALDPGTGLLSAGYAKDVTSEAGRYVHLRDVRPRDGEEGGTGLWRISLEAVDAWTLRSGRDHSDQQDRGLFADLLASS